MLRLAQTFCGELDVKRSKSRYPKGFTVLSSVAGLPVPQCAVENTKIEISCDLSNFSLNSLIAQVHELPVKCLNLPLPPIRPGG